MLKTYNFFLICSILLISDFKIIRAIGVAVQGTATLDLEENVRQLALVQKEMKNKVKALAYSKQTTNSVSLISASNEAKPTTNPTYTTNVKAEASMSPQSNSATVNISSNPTVLRENSDNGSNFDGITKFSLAFLGLFLL